MKIADQLESISEFRGGMLSIGNFDGVHRGHRLMINTLVEKAKAANVPSIVMTFDPPPIAVLFPEKAPPRICTVNRRIELIEELGVDCLIIFPTTKEFLALSPQEFFDQIVVNSINASGMVEGPNFFFGHKREGEVNTLHKLCQSVGIDLKVVETVLDEGEFISSTRIRNLISSGDVKKAGLLLGKPFQLAGTVVSGSARGRQIGFPTANLSSIDTMIPNDGVYAGNVELGGKLYAAAINIGSNPTFDDATQKIEVHVIDFEGDLYDKEIQVDFLDQLRDVQSFDGLDELKEQLVLDIEQAKTIWAQM